MFFGGGKHRKIEALMATANEEAHAGQYADAKKAAEEAFKLAAPSIGDHVSSAQQAQLIMVYCAMKVGDWAYAQSTLERGLQLFEQSLGHDDRFAAPLRHMLMSVYFTRENHRAAVDLARAALEHFSPENPEHAVLRALTAQSLAALGQIDEAIATAEQAFTDAKKHVAEAHPEGPATLAICAVQLATVLIETGRDPAAGFELVEDRAQKSEPRTADELIAFLKDSVLRAKAHLAASYVNEAAHYLDVTLKLAFGPACDVGGEARTLYGKLQWLRGEALARLGQLTEAAEILSAAIREIEAAEGPRSPDLLPVLEAYARVLRTTGDVRSADTQERRVAAIRSLITGKKVAPVKQEPRRVVTTVWPRRTLAGVFHLRNVNPSALTTIILSLARAAQDDQGFETIPVEGDQAFLVMNRWKEVWEPAVALTAKRYLAALRDILALVSGGVVAAGGRPLELEPWAAVRDDLPCSFERWPPGRREQLVGGAFAELPEWGGDAAAPRWFGDGIRSENGRPRHVSPSVTVSFIPGAGLRFDAIGPGALIDKWFVACARATQLFAGDAYSRISAAPADAQPFLDKVPQAKA